MFKEKEMKKALSWLISLYEPEDYEDYDEDEYGEDGGLCLEEVCQALRDEVQHIYQYTIDSPQEHGFKYRGKELFRMRGCQISRKVEISSYSGVVTEYAKELWLLEDMSFALVHCVGTEINCDGMDFVSEYRTIIKRFEGKEDLFMSPEILLEELELSCVPLWEGTATIYEL